MAEAHAGRSRGDAKTVSSGVTQIAFDVHPCTVESLVSAVAKIAKAPEDSIRAKLHLTYFEEYFKALGAQSLLVEWPYIDRDYLEDYAAYYVKCFDPPERECARIHVFTTGIVDKLRESLEDANLSVVLNPDDDSYLGFIVVKPLPVTPIGRTCLKTYPTEKTGRHFPALRKYSAHVFGTTFDVETLAFQEQDTEVAACATSALWSAFQATGIKLNHSVPTPVEITRFATARNAGQTAKGLPARSFPANEGLSLDQMADAVRHMGLEPYAVSANEPDLLQAELYAYLRSGIPAIMAIYFLDIRHVADPATDLATFDGGHAVAVTGYHLQDGPPRKLGASDLYLRAARIDKIYAHDDGVGPFSRQILGKTRYRTAGSPHELFVLEGSWSGAVAHPGSLLIPIYSKMRMKFEAALEAVTWCDETCKAFGVPDLEWDIFITSSADLKAELRSHSALTGPYRAEVLTDSLPRFVWRARAMDHSNRDLFELLFDATALVQGKFFLRTVEFDDTLDVLHGLPIPPALDPYQRAILESLSR